MFVTKVYCLLNSVIFILLFPQNPHGKKFILITSKEKVKTVVKISYNNYSFL